MGILTTLGLVIIPLLRSADEAKKRLAAVEAERDLWRAECLAAQQKLTEASIAIVRLEAQLTYWQTACADIPLPNQFAPSHQFGQSGYAAQQAIQDQYARYRERALADPSVVWTDCTCVPGRSEALQQGS